MKIAFDLTCFSGVHAGGKDEVAYNLLRGFSELGYAHNIVCFCHEDLVNRLQKINNSLEIYVIPKVNNVGKIQIVNLIRREYHRIKYIKKYLRTNKVDLIVFMCKLSALSVFDVPSIVIPHDIQVFEAGNIHGVQYTSWKRRVLEKSWIGVEFFLRNHIIAISDFDKQEIEKFIPWAKGKVKRIYNPVVFDEICNHITNKKFVTALNIQHLHKNVVTIIRAFNMIANEIDCKLILVGRYPENIEELRRFVKEKNIEDKVIFTGFISEEELKEIINNTIVYINSSYFEGFGMTAVEMMGRGIPTIVSANSASPEVTRGLCRYYEPADDFEKLSEEILAEINNPSTVEKLEYTKRMMRSSYDYLKISDEYWEFFNSVIYGKVSNMAKK